MLTASRRMDNAWMTLDQRGAPPAELLSADIYDSWMRCISLGLDTLRPPSPEFVSTAVLRQEQQRCSLIRGLALAEMHTLHQQIAGSNFMIAFANANGRCSTSSRTRASVMPRTQLAFGPALSGLKPFAAPTASAPPRISSGPSSFTGASTFSRATTILLASRRQSSRPMANWPEYWTRHRIACRGRRIPRRSSRWPQPRSRMVYSANITAETS